jgi:hypothetical protein
MVVVLVVMVVVYTFYRLVDTLMMLDGRPFDYMIHHIDYLWMMKIVVVLLFHLAEIFDVIAYRLLMMNKNVHPKFNIKLEIKF